MAFVPPSPNLLAFEAVARRRSFALAAAELHLTASAISHQVARLESQLGVRLFERSAHGVRVSLRAARIWRASAVRLAAIAAATEDLRQGVSNSLYVHSSPSFASLWLMPRLRGFAQSLSGNIAESLGRTYAQRFRTGAGRHRYPLRRAAMAGTGHRTALRGTRSAAGEPGLHPGAPAEAAGAAVRRPADPEQCERRPVVGLVRRSSRPVTRPSVSRCSSIARRCRSTRRHAGARRRARERDHRQDGHLAEGRLGQCSVSRRRLRSRRTSPSTRRGMPSARRSRRS